jgi:hypothetical protein
MNFAGNKNFHVSSYSNLIINKTDFSPAYWTQYLPNAAYENGEGQHTSEKEGSNPEALKLKTAALPLEWRERRTDRTREEDHAKLVREAAGRLLSSKTRSVQSAC